MNRRISLALLSAAALGCATSCISSKPPAAISKSTYTGLDKSEQQMIPEGTTFLTLDDAQNLAVQNNPSFKSAYFAIAAARANYYKAFSGYLPTVTATYNLGQDMKRAYTQGAGNNTVTTFSTPALGAKMVVFDSLVREMNLLASKHQWKQSEQAERDARRLLLRSVAYAYNDVMLSAAKIKIATEDMRYNNDLLKITEVKFQAGTSNLSDVLNFKVRYNTAESSLYDAQYSYAIAKYALAALLGLTEGNIPEQIKFPEMPSPDGEILADIGFYLDTALTNRPDLKQYREALETAKYSYYSSIASFGPTVSAYADVAYNGNEVRTTGRWGNASSNVHANNGEFDYGMNVSWELFSGGRTYYGMRAAQAAVTQADYQLAGKWISVVADVRTAYDNYVTSLKKVRLNQKNLEIVRKTRDLVNQDYTAGNSGITRLNEAQRDLVDAETSLATSVINMHNAKAQLMAATNAI